MLLVSEPEAAAIYTARYLKELDGADFLKVCVYVLAAELSMTLITYTYHRKMNASRYATPVGGQSYVRTIHI